MTAQPQWSPVDDETSDLLSLVAIGSMATGTSDAEWDLFKQMLKQAADDNGIVYPNRLRPLVRSHVAPQRLGAFTNRALSQGLIAYTGEWEVSDDTEGRNAGKPARVMVWLGGAS